MVLPKDEESDERNGKKGKTLMMEIEKKGGEYKDGRVEMISRALTANRAC